MFFASPTLRRAVLSTPRQVATQADLALARLLHNAQQSASAQMARHAQRDFSASTAENGQTTLTIDVPGVSREHLQVQIDGAHLHLRSTDASPRHVQRTWELPQAIDAQASTAKLENGVLTLVLTPLQPVETAVTLNIQ